MNFTETGVAFYVGVTMKYDGYNFMANCPELELYGDSFFKEY